MTKLRRSAPHPKDVAMGLRLRLVRMNVGLSQDIVAREVGVTFQQIQKYEMAKDRIAWSRLCEMASAIGISLVDLVRPLDTDKQHNPDADYLHLLPSPEATQMLRAFNKVKSRKRRRAILDMLLAMDDGD